MRLTGNRSDAEDLVQEAFVAAYTGQTGFQGRAGILTWLLGIAVRRWRDGRRRKEPEMVALDEEIAPDGGFPSSGGVSVEEKTIHSVLIADALKALEPAYREAVLLVVSQGLTYREAAEVLGEPVGTVKWRVSEAVRKMRQALVIEEGE